MKTFISKMKDYQQTFVFSQPVSHVYGAITEHIPDWWTNDFKGDATIAGEQFSIGFGGTRKTMEILEATSDNRVVWKCIEAYIDMASLKRKSEWAGTTMTWTLETAGTNTILTFLHTGLNPNMECYEVCEAGWNSFLLSLQNYVKTGKGSPFLKTTP